MRAKRAHNIQYLFFSDCPFCRAVTYAIEMDGKFIIVENVPARVCVETGELCPSRASHPLLCQAPPDLGQYELSHLS